MNKNNNIINGRIVSKLFSAIKHDNLEKLQEVLSINPQLINFINRKKENLLFYAFENNSKKIIDFIIEEKPDFIKQKNILGLTILHELVIKNKDLKYFFNKFNNLNNEEKMDFYKSHDPNGNNIFFFSTQNNKIEQLKILIDNCPNYRNIENHQNEHGQTLSHFIALNISESIFEIKDYISKESLKKQDFLMGYTPLMIAATKQNKENFELFFNLVDKEQISYNGNHLFHLAASNNLEVIDLLVDKGLITNKKNKLGQSALNIAISKNKIDIVEKLFNLFKKDTIYTEDVVYSTKLSSKYKSLFLNIVKNENNEKLNEDEKQRFLEGIFLHSDWDSIEQINQSNNFKDILNIINFETIFSKTIAGRKDMQKKIEYLISEKNHLSTKESIVVAFALNNLPRNQISYIFQKTELLNKIKKEDQVLIASIFLERNMNISNIHITMNENNSVQNVLKNNLKYSKVNLDTQINNINHWLSIIKDENSVFKHYGKLIAKLEKPFDFIENNKNLLTKEKQKKLIFYTMTSIIKDNLETSEEVKEIISNYQMLLKSVIEGIIKYNKIPQNQDIIKLIKEEHFISQESLVDLLEKNKNTVSVADFVSNHLNLFKLNEISNELISVIGNHKEGGRIFESLLKFNKGNKDVLISKYLELVGEGEIKNLNQDFLKIKIFKSKKIKESIEKNLFSIIEKNENINPNLISELWGIIEPKLEEFSLFSNQLFEKQKFKQITNIQKSIKKHFNFKEIDIKKLDLINLNSSILINDYTSKDFFELIQNNSSNISTLQINEFLSYYNECSKENNLSIGILGKFLLSIDQNTIKKVNQDNLFTAIKNSIEKYNDLNFISKSIEEDSFDLLCNSIEKKIPINILLELRKSEVFGILNEETKIFINKESLDYKLENKNFIKETKRFKI